MISRRKACHSASAWQQVLLLGSVRLYQYLYRSKVVRPQEQVMVEISEGSSTIRVFVLSKTARAVSVCLPP